MKSYKTEQEKFWAGEFGSNYIDRNQSKNLIASNIALFSKILSISNGISSIIEFGANIGLNLQALHALLPNTSLTAVEINDTAVTMLKQFEYIKIYHDSILEASINERYDLTLIKGVLIHINPNELEIVYEKLYNFSNRYICIVEYYNPTPVELSYRGHEDKLFKRDFAGELMDKYSDLKLIDYGFVYHRDANFPQDDCTWFLLEKGK
ncbi:pseudaminic acid biosynthesis-associated methylase [Sulfurospirillum sp. MES]|uniref:pseudaminic acid biosynthesis-associated methylase n=1 Tax=Sulfurospirillum sp. MES TaxID=1565314 RepID=UPI000543EAC7|nr:pseudaminic acid biosynthesis-associated methylase [Sulfurospirillum sp. MES]KHG33247.1 MAG: pseudaminic acid biosynthesis-associated methylase [Sulfurospirillum sp. MES]